MSLLIVGHAPKPRVLWVVDTLPVIYRLANSVETPSVFCAIVKNEPEGPGRPGACAKETNGKYVDILTSTVFFLPLPPPAPFTPNSFIDLNVLSTNSLFLNVWTPPGAKKGSKLPVMTWLYGGGFEQGASSHPEYDGRRMAEKGESAVRVPVVYLKIVFRWMSLGCPPRTNPAFF